MKDLTWLAKPCFSWLNNHPDHICLVWYVFFSVCFSIFGKDFLVICYVNYRWIFVIFSFLFLPFIIFLSKPLGGMIFVFMFWPSQAFLYMYYSSVLILLLVIPSNVKWVIFLCSVTFVIPFSFYYFKSFFHLSIRNSTHCPFS